MTETALIPPYEDLEVARAWQGYEARKAAWKRDNPGAYPSEYLSAMRVIAEELGL